MIRIVAKRDKGSSYLMIDGHANFSPGQADIVCAGVSAILQAAMLGFDAIAQQYPDHVSFDLIPDAAAGSADQYTS